MRWNAWSLRAATCSASGASSPSYTSFGGLRDALDPKVDTPLVGQLDQLYDYMGRRLLHANLRNDVSALDEVSALLQKVRNSWVQVPLEARRPAGVGA